MLPLVSNVLGGSQMAKAQDEGDWLGALAGAIQGAGGPAGAIFLGPLGMAKAGIQSEMKSKIVQHALKTGEPDIKRQLWEDSRQFLGADGGLRKEIPDVGAKLSYPKLEGVPTKNPFTGKYEDHLAHTTRLEHPEIDLHSLYDLPPFVIKQDPNLNAYGWFISPSETRKTPLQLRLNMHPVQYKDGRTFETALHEGTHGVQFRENFEGGFSPSLATKHPEFSSALRSKGLPTDVHAINLNDLDRDTAEWLSGLAYNTYRRSMGENEANNVAQRAVAPWLYEHLPEITSEHDYTYQIKVNDLLRSLGIRK